MPFGDEIMKIIKTLSIQDNLYLCGPKQNKKYTLSEDTPQTTIDLTQKIN